MIESISFSIVLAAFVDTFILSGFFTYGAAIVAAATLAFTSGMSEQQVFFLALAGVVFAEVLNFFSSKLLKADRWLTPRILYLNEKPGRFYYLVSSGLHQRSDNFLHSAIKHTALRFIPISRPINSALFGTFSSFGPKAFLVILVSSATWMAFWVFLFGNLLQLIEEKFGPLSF